MKLTEIELLAALENLRICHPDNDHILRVASAIVASCFGYTSRIEWTEKALNLGLVEYGLNNGETAKLNYKRLMDKLDS